jgi:hypothetical protein
LIHTEIFIKLDVKSRFSGATPPLGIRCILEIGFRKVLQGAKKSDKISRLVVSENTAN